MTPQVVQGKHLWDKNNCMGCHTLFGEGAYYAPELTKVYDRRGPAWMRVFLKDPEAMFPGERKMVNYHFTDEEIESLIAFFQWAGRIDLNGFPADPPLRAGLGGNAGAPSLSGTQAHAGGNPAALPPPGVYQALCVACHSLNGAGGTVGPALDSAFARKDPEALVAWLRDPLKVKPDSKMPKLPLSDAQIDSLAEFLTSLGGEP